MRPRVTRGAQSPERSFSPQARPFLCWESTAASTCKVPQDSFQRQAMSSRVGFCSPPAYSLTLTHQSTRALGLIWLSTPQPQLECALRSLQATSKSTVLKWDCRGLFPGSCLHSSSSSITDPLENPKKTMNLLAFKVYKFTKTMLHLITEDFQSSWSPVMEAQAKSYAMLMLQYTQGCCCCAKPALGHTP